MTNSVEKELAVVMKITANENDVNDISATPATTISAIATCNVQLHLCVLVIGLNKIMSLSVDYKESFKRTRHRLVSFFDILLRCCTSQHGH